MKKLAAALLSLFIPFNAASADMCMTKEAFKRAIENYEEQKRFEGLWDNGARINQLYQNPESKSFTIVEVRPNGTHCIIGGGKGIFVKAEPKGPEA